MTKTECHTCFLELRIIFCTSLTLSWAVETSFLELLCARVLKIEDQRSLGKRSECGWLGDICESGDNFPLGGATILGGIPCRHATSKVRAGIISARSRDFIASVGDRPIDWLSHTLNVLSDHRFCPISTRRSGTHLSSSVARLLRAWLQSTSTHQKRHMMQNIGDLNSWVTGNDSSLSYRRIIGSGGSGDVHEV